MFHGKFHEPKMKYLFCILIHTFFQNKKKIENLQYIFLKYSLHYFVYCHLKNGWYISKFETKYKILLRWPIFIMVGMNANHFKWENEKIEAHFRKINRKRSFFYILSQTKYLDTDCTVWWECKAYFDDEICFSAIFFFHFFFLFNFWFGYFYELCKEK